MDRQIALADFSSVNRRPMPCRHFELFGALHYRPRPILCGMASSKSAATISISF